MLPSSPFVPGLCEGVGNLVFALDERTAKKGQNLPHTGQKERYRKNASDISLFGYCWALKPLISIGLDKEPK